MSSDNLAGFPKDLLGRYECYGHLARGNMGVLFRAQDKTLLKDVAIKALPSRAQLGTAKVVRFQKEAKTAGRLSHPNIVTVLDFGVTKSGDPYLVMDYIAGRSLEELVKRNGPLSISDALVFFIQIADGLSHAHNHGVIHRDIKSSNIMIDETDFDKPTAKIVDFGVAHMRLTDKEKSLGFESTGGILIGSPGYMSPEVINREPADQRSDVYSMGCLMFETLAGHIPYRAESALEVFKQHVQAPIPKLLDSLQDEKESTELACRLSEIVERCLAKKPDERFQSAVSLKDELLECAELLDDESLKENVKEDVRSAELIKSWRAVGLLDETRLPITLICGLVVIFGIGLAVGLTNMILGSHRLHLGSANAVHPTPLAAKEFESGLTDQELAEGKVPIDSGNILDLSFSQLTDDGLSALRLYSAGVVDLSSSRNLTDAGMKHLAGVKGLDYVKLKGLPITDKGVAALVASCPNISRLALDGTKITDKAMAELAKLKKLNNLSLSSSQVTTKGVALLKDSPLIDLDISRTAVSPQVVSSGFKRLAHIALDGKTLEKGDLAVCADLPYFNAVSLNFCSLDREILFEILKIDHMKRVKIALPKGVSSKDLDELLLAYQNKYKYGFELRKSLLPPNASGE